VPTALQEQNSYPGLTMRLFSRSATEIYLGFPEAASRLRKGRATRVLDTGNPIEPPPSPRPDRSTLLREWGFPGDTAHVLLVVGGSQGSRPLNAALAASIPSFVERGIHVIWATGTASFPEYVNLSSEHVRVVPYLAPIARAYAVANLCVCRAGALTTAELCAWGIPSILVPLPTAAADHQTANARALQRAGCSTILSQEDLNAARLIAEVTRVYGDAGAFAAMSAAALKRARPSAAEDIAKQLLKISDIT
jgi:UDP-N-acetylglucosamine--N-acetylmuramyl-(pentapeptide) pyrophosphoryl-undecaprenol N-acetylglucosamine transferase